MIGFQPYETFQLLIETGGADRANTLLLAACDAFARRGPALAGEIAQFEALAGRLFESADPATRGRAAEKLMRAERLSPELERLVVGNLGPEARERYLRTAPSLSDHTVVALATSADPSVCAMVASRGDLSNVALSKLFQLNSRRVYRALAANTGIVPRGPYLNALARSAQMDHQVAERLADRDDFDAALLAPAFFDLSEAHRIKVIRAFAHRRTPDAPIKRTLEQLTVATDELTRALMKLFAENRRPEVTRLLTQITGLDEVRCGQISHDTSGGALFVVLRAFSCNVYDGLKVLIHATSHDADRSPMLKAFAAMFQDVSIDAMAYLMSAWRGEVNLLDLTRTEYRPFAEPDRRAPAAAAPRAADPAIDQAISALQKIGARRAS